MNDEQVRDLEVRAVATASPDDTVLEAARRLTKRKLGTLIVVDGAGRPLGIVTDRDLMERCLCRSRDPSRGFFSYLMQSNRRARHR